MSSKRTLVLATLGTVVLGAVPVAAGAMTRSEASSKDKNEKVEILPVSATTYATTGWLCYNMVTNTISHVSLSADGCTSDEVPLAIGGYAGPTGATGLKG
ncbi:MAG: hypothetical protein F2736_07460, partial [Actinobacteria bacterium]|nr:hypothetical protein [Actinomycetota bacterium]